MSNDLQHFKDLYITECLELLSDMEERLMALDLNNPLADDLHAIFRCAHSIKGSAGAFGFTAIAGFTHEMETVLDALREHKIPLTQALVDILLKSRDVLLALVCAARDGRDMAADFGADLKAQLTASLGGGSAAVTAAPAPVATTSAGKKLARYRIQFSPFPDMMTRGNEPLLMIRELAQLGALETRVDAASLPPLDRMDPEHCYMRWEFLLESAETIGRVREVFEFVDGECTLSITEESVAAEAALTESPTPPDSQPQKTSAPHSPQASAAGMEAAGATPPPPASAAPTATPASQSIRVDVDKVDRLINMVGEVVITQAMLAMQTRSLPPHGFEHLQRGIEELTQHTRELQEAVMAVRMQPVRSIFSRMPRLVRDLAQKLGKQARLETRGEETEVDKTIIEQLSDPLTHMIRNSIDHGLEMPTDRTAAGKPEMGTVVLSASHRGGRILIEVRDDGRGINREKVLKKAREKNVVAADVQLTDAEIDRLIFAPGFSTADTISDVSGRGVGMDVVRRNIENLGGSVEVHNHPGQGSAFIISLPLTLAILDGMIIRVGMEQYIIPINSILETLRPKPADVHPMADGSTVVNIRGQFIPLFYLHQIFSIANAETDPTKILVVLVENGDQSFGIVVDELIGQQQVVIKSLEANGSAVTGIAGATILGDGRVSLILDIAGLRRLHATPTSHPRAA